jgi:putative endonuclease
MCALNRPKYITYWVYLLLCRNETVYTGVTTDLVRRFAEHKAGKGGAYTRSHGAVRIIHVEKKRGRGGALRREAEIKRWTRAKKLQYAKAHANVQ